MLAAFDLELALREVDAQFRSPCVPVFSSPPNAGKFNDSGRARATRSARRCVGHQEASEGGPDRGRNRRGTLGCALDEDMDEVALGRGFVLVAPEDADLPAHAGPADSRDPKPGGDAIGKADAAAESAAALDAEADDRSAPGSSLIRKWAIAVSK